ncbi:MAG: exonuclease SbcCD subunit D [Chloroflexi bacterium]|nr:exonuclease SbcCD subunit D [Chloroflexota bacterium]
MPEPIRLLHFADLHVGMENYGKVDPETGISSRIRDFLDRLDEVIAYAVDRDADLVIFAGDAFTTRDPDPTQQREFARRIKRLADQAPVFMLVGNHDIPGMAARATSIDIFRTLEVPNIIVGRTISSQVIQTKRGPVFVGWVPFPVRGRLLAQEDHKGASVEALDRAVEALVIGELNDLGAEAASQPMPRLLVGHFSVGGATFGSERSVMLGRDLVVQKSALADPVWDYVALGHIHKHQNLTASDSPLPEGEGSGVRAVPPVVYSGSLERIDFGEEVEDKGFCWVELERGKTEWEFVKVNARRFVTIKVDAREADDPTAAVLAKIAGRDPSTGSARGLAGAIVRVSVRLRAAQEASLRERDIEKALREAEVSTIAAIGKEVEREVRTPLGAASPETLTPVQLVERYFLSKGKSADEVRKYAQAAESLFNDE